MLAWLAQSDRRPWRRLASSFRLSLPSPGIIAALSTPAVGTRSSWASASESDGGTRLSFPSIDPGREVFQPNAVVGLCHGRASLPARRLRGPCPADRWSSRAPIHPYSSVFIPAGATTCGAESHAPGKIFSSCARQFEKLGPSQAVSRCLPSMEGAPGRKSGRIGCRPEWDI